MLAEEGYKDVALDLFEAEAKFPKRNNRYRFQGKYDNKQMDGYDEGLKKAM